MTLWRFYIKLQSRRLASLAMGWYGWMHEGDEKMNFIPVGKLLPRNGSNLYNTRESKVLPEIRPYYSFYARFCICQIKKS